MSIFRLFGRKNNHRDKMAYYQIMDGRTPVFTEFGEDIYANDIIQGCVRCIATAIGKLQPRHIRTDNGNWQQTVNGSINRLLKFKPNPYMTTTDFLEKITYLYETRKNAFIYPAYREIPVADGRVKREYTGFYPLNPTETTFLEDATGKIFVEFTFGNGQSFTLPYRDIIHWRKDYGANEIMGGDESGSADNAALLKLLKTDHAVLQGTDKAVKASLGIRGIIKVNTMLSGEAQNRELKEFEDKLKNSENGLLTMDLKTDFVPLTINPKLIEKDTMEFIVQRILNNYGISLAVYNGDFTEEQYQAFYEKALENKIISLGRCFSSALFTERELEVGNEVIFFHQGLMFTNMENKIKAVDILSSRGTLTDNQILAVFGYPPFPEGNIRKQSLNYINRELADKYQLQGRISEDKADGGKNYAGSGTEVD